MEDASELFDKQRVSYPLLSAGVAWYGQFTGDFHVKVGLSVRNINRPNISYMQLDDAYIEQRYSLFARAEYRAWSSMSLLPVLLVQLQPNYREVVYGADVKWYIEEGMRQQVSLRAGLACRHGDAIIANVMMEYNAFLFHFCYDANVSQLSSASRYIGAFEGGIVYRLAPTGRPKKIKCPVF